MKTKNNLLTGILIGISIIVVPLILMGTTNSTVNNEVGTYQAFSIMNGGYMINTKTGETWQLGGITIKKSWKKTTKENIFK